MDLEPWDLGTIQNHQHTNDPTVLSLTLTLFRFLVLICTPGCAILHFVFFFLPINVFEAKYFVKIRFMCTQYALEYTVRVLLSV